MGIVFKPNSRIISDRGFSSFPVLLFEARRALGSKTPQIALVVVCTGENSAMRGKQRNRNKK